MGEDKKFRLTIYPAMDHDFTASISFLFGTKEELVAAEKSCALLLLFIQDEVKAMSDETNLFIAEERVPGGWKEIEYETCEYNKKEAVCQN